MAGEQHGMCESALMGSLNIKPSRWSSVLQDVGAKHRCQTKCNCVWRMNKKANTSFTLNLKTYENL
jgi:hypothetical protein